MEQYIDIRFYFKCATIKLAKIGSSACTIARNINEIRFNYSQFKELL